MKLGGQMKGHSVKLSSVLKKNINGITGKNCLHLVVIC